MIVEFIGSTGAGKTTLISEVQSRLARRAVVTTSFNLVADPLSLRSVSQPTLRNLLQELVGFPYFVRSLARHKSFVFFTLRMLARQADLSIFTVNNLRSLVRKLGMYEINRRRGRDRIVLVDEGTVLTAHNVFVYSRARYTSREIEKFAALVPLPDVIVYIRAPLDSLVERTLQRPDPPRELKSKDRALVEEHVGRAKAMFDQLVKFDEIQNRALIVDNPDSGGSGHETILEAITEYLMNHKSSDQFNRAGGTLPPAGDSLERSLHVK